MLLIYHYYVYILLYTFSFHHINDTEGCLLSSQYRGGCHHGTTNQMWVIQGIPDHVSIAILFYNMVFT